MSTGTWRRQQVTGGVCGGKVITPLPMANLLKRVPQQLLDRLSQGSVLGGTPHTPNSHIRLASHLL